MTDIVKEEPKITHDDPSAVSRRWMLRTRCPDQRGRGRGRGHTGCPVLLARSRKGAYHSWISLGSIDQFPSETRLATFEIPSPIPGMAKLPLPAGWAASMRQTFRSSPSTALTSAARSAGYRNPGYSCARAMAEYITPMDFGHRGHRNGDFLNTRTECWATSYKSSFGEPQPFRTKPATVCVFSITTKGSGPCTG